MGDPSYSLAELNGYHVALDKGHIGIVAPGKASARGVDYATYDPDKMTVWVSDAKYRGPGGSYPSSIPQAKIDTWAQEVMATVQAWPNSAKKADILNAIQSGNIKGNIFKWPQ